MHHSLSSSFANDVWRLVVQIIGSTMSAGDGKGLEGVPTPDLALQMFRQRLAALQCGLTGRELDVCARTLIGLTAEGIALDLNIKKSSVSTYRKRAYARLGISSHSQLYRLLS